MESQRRPRIAKLIPQPEAITPHEPPPIMWAPKLLVGAIKSVLLVGAIKSVYGISDGALS